jgi:hypothetical protein
MTSTAVVADAPARRGGRAGRVEAALAVITAAVYLPYLVRGTGFVQDDWYALGNAHFYGAFHAAGPSQETARPGAWLVYAALFGGAGAHPLVHLLLLEALDLAAGVLLYRLVRRFLSGGIAAATAVIWLVLPNHTAPEVWSSGANIALSAVLLLGGLLVLTGDATGARRALALAALAGAILCYEASAPIAALGVLAAVWPRGGRPFDRSLFARGAVAVALPCGWILTHWHPDKHTGRSDLGLALPGHFGWGIVPDGGLATVVLLAACAGITLALGRVSLPSFRVGAGAAEWAVLAGVVVIAAGLLPFARYAYEPLGVGDRAMFLSSMGGALVLAGIGAILHRVRSAIAVVAAAVLLAGAGTARVQRAGHWAAAADDATAIVAAVQAAVPQPHGPIVVGPSPVEHGDVAAFQDASHLRLALALAYDDPTVTAVLTHSVAEFEREPAGQRIDIRAILRQ